MSAPFWIVILPLYHTPSPDEPLPLLLASIRRSLLSIGQAMEQARWLEQAGDIFFLTLSEARAAVTGQDMRQIVWA